MPRAPLRADAMQLLAMDDAPDPFDARMETPRGVSIELENVPAGPGNTAARRYARITVGEGESPEQARARLVAWAETQAMPSGDRVLTGAALEHDEDRGVTEQVGFRTYLVKGDAVVDGHDVKEASVSLDRELRSAQVLITLRSEGAERSRAFTAANVKRRLAIVVEGKVENAPVILAEIGGGSVSINVGAGAPERQLADAKRLAARLTGGPLRP